VVLPFWKRSLLSQRSSMGIPGVSVIMDFTLDKYRDLAAAILSSGYTVVTVENYLKEITEEKCGKVCVLRHDIDRLPGNAVEMAEVEQAAGIRSTYYFRSTKAVFRPRLVRAINGMGHEIGYHYETLAKTQGDHAAAYRLFRRELAQIRAVCRVTTVCPHGRPFSRWDSRELWLHHDFEEDDLVGDALLSIDYSRTVYLTETGRSWDSGKFNIRDRVQSGLHASVRTTDDVICFVRENNGPIAVQVHPERWASSPTAFALSFVRDWLANSLKYVIVTARRRRTASL